MKNTSLEPNAETRTALKQGVTERPKHQFLWSQGVANCSCGRWTLWGASLESAKRSHGYHRANLPEGTGP